MPLSWNEIKDRALAFSKEWEHETSEDAEAKSFWDGFFTIFGVPRRRVATFEQHVKKIDGKDGYIDLLWRGIEVAVQDVLDARSKFPEAPLADFYDPLTMPPELTKAHQALDRAVDAAYGRKKFTSEAERVTFLFERYQALSAPLMKPEKKSRKCRQQNVDGVNL